MSILFIDVDGTLVDYEGKAPESATIAISKARENGHLVFLCTGRSKAEGYNQLLETVGFDGYIGANGGYIEFRQQPLSHHSLTESQCQEVVSWLTNRGLEFYLEGNEALYASSGFKTRAPSTMQAYCQKKQIASQELEALFPGMIFDGNLVYQGINKISYILNSYQDFIDTKANFPNLESHTWGGVLEEALFGDLAVLDINKGLAVTEVCDYLQMDITDCYGFGDAKIDIPMLDKCQYKIAMGNGGEEIKAVADYITSSVEEDGLYKAFAHYNLI